MQNYSKGEVRGIIVFLIIFIIYILFTVLDFDPNGSSSSDAGYPARALFFAAPWLGGGGDGER